MRSQKTDKRDNHALVRRVARNIRYKRIDSVIGATLELSSLGDIVAESEKFAQSYYAKCKFHGPEEKYYVGSIAKYGILNLTFTVKTSVVLDDGMYGIELLQRLGFLPADEEREAECIAGSEILGSLDCLKEMDEDIVKGIVFLKLFLEEEGKTKRSVQEAFRLINTPSKICFPKTFRIIDACMTNSDFVWINKHFYW